MMDKNDGGPAFPHDGRDNGPGNIKGRACDGMSLRDWFAATAPFTFTDARGMMMNNGAAPSTTGQEILQFLAGIRFAYADAMIEARK